MNKKSLKDIVDRVAIIQQSDNPDWFKLKKIAELFKKK